MRALRYLVVRMSLLSLLTLSSCFVHSSEPLEKNSLQAGSIRLFEELNYCSHPVSARHLEAQRFFDQGLTFIYAFNYDAAYQSFKQASLIDPELAMAYWGMALASGPIFSVEMSPEQEKKGYEAIQKAQALASRATPCEQAYIQALAQRYAIDPSPDYKRLAMNYKDKMRELIERYPDDLDASVLFAAIAFDIDSDNLWKDTPESIKSTKEVVNALEYALKQNPDHIGANHYYIHAFESSKFPNRALASADRFRSISPILSHLVHTPSHLYIVLGDYEACIQCNEKAVLADRIATQAYGLDSSHSLFGLSHNLLFLTRSYTMAGQLKGARKSANELKNLYLSQFPDEASMEAFYSVPLFVLLRFNRWQEILDMPEPPASKLLSNGLWHAARSLAFSAQKEKESAQKEKIKAETIRQVFSKDAKANKKANELLNALILLAEAKLADLSSNSQLAIDFFRQLIAKQDALKEEGDVLNWLLLGRENLGGLLLRNENYQEAERVFREDLDKHNGNGRSLFGLHQSLIRQSKLTDALWIEKAFNRAWRTSDVVLTQEN